MERILHDRFAGIERLYGRGSVERLARAHVGVVGVGGVGSWAVEALARRLGAVESRIQALVPMAEQLFSIGRVERSVIAEILPVG